MNNLRTRYIDRSRIKNRNFQPRSQGRPSGGKFYQKGQKSGATDPTAAVNRVTCCWKNEGAMRI